MCIRDRFWLCGLAMCAGCLFTMSRGAWLALAAAAVLFALLIDRRLLALMLVCGAVACTLPFVRSRIGYLFTPQFADSNARGGRAKRWATAIGYLKATDPVFGMGYGMYGGAVAVKNPVLPWVEYMYVDNYYVKILTENGVVGVTAFGMMLLGLIGNGLRGCVRTAKTRWSPLCAGMLCGLVGVLLHSVFESIWEEPYMMALFFAVAAMMAWAGLLRRRAEAVLREAVGADEDWELYDSRLIQDDGIPYVCFRLEGETEQYALVPPEGSCVYAAELDPNTDRYCITGVF